MVLSQAAKYAVRAVLCVAHSEGAPVLGRDVASRLEAPIYFLAKILQTLARQGILRSCRGRGGGFTLGGAASQITILAVIQAIEGPLFGQECLLGLGECLDEEPCALHHQWKRMRDDLLTTLEKSTVQQLLDGDTDLELPELESSR
ncbi:RrF2 family transcriptional regulator [Candidatus Latescibacterota bacterium]